VTAFPFWWMGFVRVVDADFPKQLASPLPAFAAYIVGALLAELTSKPIGDDPTVHRAAFLARTIQDYVPSWIRTLPWAVLAISGAVLMIDSGVDRTSLPVHAVIVVLAAAGVALLAELAARRIVQRPQRGVDVDLLAADDALRATAISMTVGAAVLAGLAAASEVTTPILPSNLGWWTAPFLAWSLVLFGVEFGVLCLIVRQETWGHRRRHRQPVTAAVP